MAFTALANIPRIYWKGLVARDFFHYPVGSVYFSSDEIAIFELASGKRPPSQERIVCSGSKRQHAVKDPLKCERLACTHRGGGLHGQ